ncbi:GntR family transcriptional regulator [Pseudoprimorskyibacter insulae]|uniref:HTH-type transcriptional repressor RspR n=1 Tax=Pseudoprimorskyibacter insulae TaxID=1695997 RepID=A0A2R8AVS2_9RHOB|nr:GntR family transcriptional regulator [Pseudoprimorskyibacter insulae]SPF80047.1 HTH-type transcriptional repressor RspR [Pseudoprimorskyibacter insulae]
MTASHKMNFGGLGPSISPGHTSAAQRVYEDLRERIVTLELPPETTLSRSDLARTYGVSQTPIREAMQKLEQDGLIRIYPQSRTEVSRIDVKELREAHFLRVALECEVVRRLAVMEDRSALEQALAISEMQVALRNKPDQFRMFSDLDKAMHRVLFEAVGMRALYELLARKLGHLARCQRLELPRKGKVDTILDQHRAVMDALVARDPEAAVEAMRVHVSGTITRIEKLQHEFPDYFTNQS